MSLRSAARAMELSNAVRVGMVIRQQGGQGTKNSEAGIHT